MIGSNNVHRIKIVFIRGYDEYDKDVPRRPNEVLITQMAGDWIHVESHLSLFSIKHALTFTFLTCFKLIF